jgi:serine/threonine protein kinase/Tfp pilus assembly protein PilF
MIDKQSFLSYLLSEKKLFTPEEYEKYREEFFRFLDQSRTVGNFSEYSTPTSFRGSREDPSSPKNSSSLEAGEEYFERETMAFQEAFQSPLPSIVPSAPLPHPRPPQSTPVMDLSFWKDPQALPQRLELLAKDRYAPIETLGQGGMGIVQRVRDRILGREVALKKIRIRPAELHQLSKKEQMLLWRLRREASIMATLEHPHIVTLYDMQRGAGGELNFTMKKVEGETLLKILKRHHLQKLSEETEAEILRIFLKICEVMAYAHAQGVIHRDLKTENVMVGPFGEVYVLDWGIAKKREIGFTQGNSQENKNDPNALNRESPKNTTRLLLKNKDSTTRLLKRRKGNTTRFSTSSVSTSSASLSALATMTSPEHLQNGMVLTIGGLGTPGYMPLEQQRDATSVDFSADIYALGKILRECYTGLTPYEELQKVKEAEKKEEKTSEKTTTSKGMGGANASKPSTNKSNNKSSSHPFSKSSSKNLILEEHFNAYERKLKESIPSEIIAICDKATELLPKDRYANLYELMDDIQRYQENSQVSAKDYALTEILKKWWTRYKIHFLATSLLLTLFFSLIGYFWNLKEAQEKEFLIKAQEKKEKEFQENFQKACEEKEKIQSSSSSSSSSSSFLTDASHLQHFLNALQYLGQALRLVPGHPDAEKEQSEIGQELIQFACERKQFELARYVAQELQALSSLDSTLKASFFTRIENAQQKRQKQHLTQLQFWFEQLQNQKLEPWLNENAIFEISKMGELAVFQKLLEQGVLGLSYFLQEEKRSPEKENFYFTILAILERLQNPEASSFLFQAIEKLSQKLIPLKQRPLKDIEYLVALSYAFVACKPQNKAKAFQDIRLALGKEQVFWNRTRDLYQQLLRFETLEELESKDPQRYYQRSLLKLEQGDFDAALTDLNLALTYKRDDPLFHIARGDIYVAKVRAFLQQNAMQRILEKWLKNAEEDYTKAIIHSSQNARAYLQRAKLFFLQSRNEGLRDLNRALEIDPQLSEAYLLRADILMSRASYPPPAPLLAQALEDLNRAILYNSELSLAYFSRGNCQNQRKELVQAIEDFTRAIELDPHLAPAYVNRADAKKQLGQIDSALLDINEAIRLNPQDSKNFRNRGHFKVTKEDYDGAIVDFTQEILLEAKGNNSYGYYYRAHAKQCKGDLEGAIQDYQSALQRLPQDESSIRNCGALFKSQKRYKEMINLYTHAIRFNVQLERSYFERAFAYENLKQYPLALEDYTQVLQQNLFNQEAYYRRGFLYELEKERSQAQKDYDFALSLGAHAPKFF